MVRTFFLLVLSALGLITSAQNADHVVISEIYGGGGNSGSLFTHDFIELYNPTAQDIILNGWSVQYASSTGSSWSKTELTGTIPAKGFYLIQQAMGNGGSIPLPVPDAIGTLALSATTGKVALVNTINTLSGTCPTGADIIDFVGFGNANCFEGASSAPATTNTTSIERKASATSTALTMSFGGTEELLGNGYDTDINGDDFVLKQLNEINPQNSTITEGVVGNIVSVFAGINPAEPSTNGSFTVSLSTPAPVGGVTVTYTLSGSATEGVDYTNPESGTITIPESGTIGSVHINIIDDLIAEGNETIVLTLQSASNGYIVSSSTATLVVIDDEFVITKIHEIQGSGTTANPGSYTIEAIVTGVYEGLDPAGFYVQEEDVDADEDINTSEGIFIVSEDVVSVGDKVRISGTVQEDAASPSFNQAILKDVVVDIVTNNEPLPSVVDITLPVNYISDFEKYEGMLVRFPETLTVTNNYDLGRFGEVGLSGGGIVYQPTQITDVNDVDPEGTTFTGTSNLSQVQSTINDNLLRTIILDDGTHTTATLPYADPVNHTLRLGSTINNLTGILGYAFSKYRIQPIITAYPVFNYAPRPAVPLVEAGNIKVLSFNVLNYFNGNGSGGGFPTSRGAHSLAEFNRQRDKIINAIAQLDGDIVGLLEIENDGTGPLSAIQDLVNGLNDVLGAGTYDFIEDGTNFQTYNTDEIRCGIIYKPSVVTPDGSALLSSSDSFSRPPLAQKFVDNASSVSFNVVVNHFKSKGCGGASGPDLDQNDGQSCFNEQRKKQSFALVNFFNTILIPSSGTDRIISLGDYNAYYEEDPLDILRSKNYEVLGSSSDYSYQFSGQIGSLDHAIVSPSLLNHVTSVATWNINAAEPVYLDYNDLINDGSGDIVNPFSDFYQPDAFRSSDHDPIVVGLDLVNIPLPLNLQEFEAKKHNSFAQISWLANEYSNTIFYEVERAGKESNSWKSIATIPAVASGSNKYEIIDYKPLSGINLYRLKCVLEDGHYIYSKTRQVDFDQLNLFNVYPNPVRDILHISYGDHYNTASVDVHVEILNVFSQVMVEESIKGSTSLLTIDLSSFPSGIYYIKVMINEKEIGKSKLIKY